MLRATRLGSARSDLAKFDVIIAGAGELLVESFADGWWYTASLPNGRRIVACMTDADQIRPFYAAHAVADWLRTYDERQLHRYRTWIEAAHASYQTGLRNFYAEVARWPNHLFWRRRRPPPRLDRT
jgi:hypothetical protein